MDFLLEALPLGISFEEEDFLIRRFLITLESEIIQTQISPSSFQNQNESLLSDFPQNLEIFFQNLYVRENYINILISIISKKSLKLPFICSFFMNKIDHLLERSQSLFIEKQRNQEILNQELEKLKESLENSRKKANDFEKAYKREEEAKNELFGELDNLEDRSNQIKELFLKTEMELEDSKEILNYHKDIEESLRRNKETLRKVQEENKELREKNDLLRGNLLRKSWKIKEFLIRKGRGIEISTSGL